MGRPSLAIFCLHVAWRFVVPPAVEGRTSGGVGGQGRSVEQWHWEYLAVTVMGTRLVGFAYCGVNLLSRNEAECDARY